MFALGASQGRICIWPSVILRNILHPMLKDWETSSYAAGMDSCRSAGRNTAGLTITWWDIAGWSPAATTISYSINLITPCALPPRVARLNAVLERTTATTDLNYPSVFQKGC